MGTINLSDYKDIYLQTAKDYADSLSKSCNALGSNPLDHGALIQLHISSHSLRSQSQVMNYANMSAITGEIEKIARAVLEGKGKITIEFLSVLKESVEGLSLCLSRIEKENKERDLEPITKKLEMLRSAQHDI